MTSLFIILFTFIHNSSSKKDRKITASKLLTHRFSAGCIGEFLQFLLSACFPRPNFDRKVVNLVLPMLPKENTVNFSHFFFTFIAKTVFESLFVSVYSCSFSFLSKNLL